MPYQPDLPELTATHNDRQQLLLSSSFVFSNRFATEEYVKEGSAQYVWVGLCSCLTAVKTHFKTSQCQLFLANGLEESPSDKAQNEISKPIDCTQKLNAEAHVLARILFSIKQIQLFKSKGNVIKLVKGYRRLRWPSLPACPSSPIDWQHRLDNQNPAHVDQVYPSSACTSRTAGD